MAGLTPDFIERLVAIVERSTLAELDYSEDGARIRILRTPAGVRAEPADIDAHAPDAPDAETIPPSTGHVVRAGIASTFYRAAAPGAAPFVVEGDAVEDGQTLGLLEAMKMLNPVEADRAGRIAAIVAADGAGVAAGDPLFVLEPGA